MSDSSRESIEDTIDLTVQQFADAFFAPAQVELPVTFGAATHVGKRRSQNEDHFAVLRLRRTTDLLLTSLAREGLSIPDACSYSMIVADGMGGMNSGELASRLALRTMVELSGQATSWVMRFTDVNTQQIEQRVHAYVQRIHSALQQQGEDDPAKQNMGTTWTSAHLLGDSPVIVHLGDSRAYLFRDQQLRQITRDQTMAQSLIDSGMDPGSVGKFTHILVNSFGGGNDDARAAIYHVSFEPSDQLLLCTDGLTNMVPNDEIEKELREQPTPQAVCDALVQHALDNGGRDNVTVVLASADPADTGD